MSGTLTIVGTPIGNLSDFSPRAIQTLQETDFVAAEDTRITVKLLNHFQIKKPLISYYEHNKQERGDKICRKIMKGEKGVLVSDAGMPSISDPGEELVAQCFKLGIPIHVVPGPTALIAALAISGLPTKRFTFEGFLNFNKKKRLQELEDLKAEIRTMIFYEAPHKLLSTLEDMFIVLGNRRIAIVRELTKLHEEVIRMHLSEAICQFQTTDPRGEFVLVVEAAQKKEAKNISFEEVIMQAKQRMEEGLSISEAAKEIAKISPYKKGDIYRHLLSK